MALRSFRKQPGGAARPSSPFLLVSRRMAQFVPLEPNGYFSTFMYSMMACI